MTLGRPSESADHDTLKDIAWEYLMYRDIHHMLSEEAVAGIEGYYTEKTTVTPVPSNVLRYAQALQDVMDDSGEKALHTLTTELTHQFMDYAERAELMQGLRPYSLSKSWVYWDIAKQRYYHDHREDSIDPCPECTIGDPMRDESIQRIIVNRHLGWEAFAQWNMHDGEQYQRDEHATSLFEQWLARRRRFDILSARMQPDIRTEIEELLAGPPKEVFDTLSSHALARLGELLRSTVDAMQPEVVSPHSQ